MCENTSFDFVSAIAGRLGNSDDVTLRSIAWEESAAPPSGWINVYTEMEAPDFSETFVNIYRIEYHCIPGDNKLYTNRNEKLESQERNKATDSL
jgi:hypothetical protein